MNTLEGLVVCYLINSLWQVPLLYAAAWLCARILRPLGPAIEHRILATALLLQALLPALSLISLASLPNLFHWIHPVQTHGAAHVSVTLGASFADGMLHLPTPLRSMAAFLYACTCLYFCARFLWRSATVSRIRREAMLLPPTSSLFCAWEAFRNANCCNDVTLAVSSRVSSPATIGIFHKLILLPASTTPYLSAEDFRTILAHEFAHLRRNDFALNLVYELLTLPVSYHPISWLTREAVVETREMVCDQAAASTIGSTKYAHSLLRLAALFLTRPPLRATHAIGIFDANAFERRLMTLTQKPKQIHGPKRSFVIITCLAFAAGTCGTALALRIHVDPSASAGGHAPATGQASPVKVASGVMAGNLQCKNLPVYPADAKAKKIQGSVVLHAVIGEDGKINTLTIISGPKGLQESATDAVRKWVYKPFLLNGSPTAVDTTITVTYSIG